MRLYWELGFDSYAVAGHDRGARVAHRMALDHPERVTKLAVLDIVPTHHVFATADKDLAPAYYHWFFLMQPYYLALGASHRTKKPFLIINTTK